MRVRDLHFYVSAFSTPPQPSIKQMRTELLRLRIVSLTLVVLVRHIGFGQAAAGQQRSTHDTSPHVPTPEPAAGSRSASANEQILKELDAMRARIQELESQLKAQSAGHVSEGNA